MNTSGLNILYVLNSGKPGGMEQHVLDLVTSMVSRGHNVFVWCKNGSFVSEYQKAGAKVFFSEIKFELDPIYIIRLVVFLMKHRIDVIHAHELKASANALLSAFIARTRVRITHIHTPMSEWIVKNHLRKMLTKLQIFCYSLLVNFMGTAEIALTPSRARIKSREGIKKNKLIVIPNGVDLVSFEHAIANRELYRTEIKDRFHIPSDHLVFGLVSRMTEEKGHEVLIRAFKKFTTVNPKIKASLLLAGGGILEKELKDLAKSLDIFDRVFFTGVFDPEDKLKYFSTIDVFVFPSLAEGFGIVLLEAMYFCPHVIASDIEVLREVGADTVKYFEKNNIDSLCEQMQFAINAVSKSPLNSRSRVKELYSHTIFSDRYEKLYLRLLSPRRP